MHLKVDGIEVDVPPGTLVKDAAARAGIIIPGLCDHSELTPYGGCRLCLVEIDGIRGYPSSCTMPASEGMSVRTDTPALRDLRRNILEMLLSQHPCICLTCERAGRCDEIREAMRKAPQSMGCRYCPADRMCELQEVVERVGLNKVELPHLSRTKEVVRSPFFDRDPNLCILCGRCIRACEDRGLGVISFVHRGFEAGIGTAFEKPLEDSGCRFCGACVDVCPTGSLVERLGRWGGVPDEIIETTCPYCSANCQIGLEIKNGRLVRARPAANSRLCVRGRFSLEFVGRDRLNRPLVRKDGRLVEVGWDEALDRAAEGLSLHRGQKFALFTSGILPNEALYMASRFASQVMGSPAVAADTVSLECSPEDLQGPVVVVGAIGETNPATELALRSRRPIVIGPFETLLARGASRWLRSAPGEEALLLDALREALSGKRIARSTFHSEDIIVRAAKEISGCSVVLGPDCSAQVSEAAKDLAMASGGRLCMIGQNCNSRGAAALGLNKNFGKAYRDLVAGELSAAYMAGFNPARENRSVEKPLSGLDLLVVQDLFLTETARLADVIFPASSFAEVDGTFLGSGERLLYLRKAAVSIGRPDWQIVAELARRMGGKGFDHSGPKEVLDEMVEHLLKQPPGVPGSGHAVSSEEQPSVQRQSEQQLQMAGSHSIFWFGSGTRTSRVYDLEYLTRKIGVRRDV